MEAQSVKGRAEMDLPGGTVLTTKEAGPLEGVGLEEEVGEGKDFFKTSLTI